MGSLNKKPISVLHVDDCRTDALLIKTLLNRSENNNYDLISTVDLKQSMQALAANNFDIILLDLFLPDSAGLDTLLAVRKVVADTPIIVITGDDKESIGMQIVRKGAQDYLVKGQINQPVLTRSIQYAIDRRLSEAALRASEERFSLAVDGANGGIWDWPDIHADEQYWSPRFREMLGYADDEVEASYSSFKKLLHPEDRSKVILAIKKHIESKVPFDIDFRALQKTGEYRWFHARGDTQRDTQDKPLRMAGSIIDVNERKEDENILIGFYEIALDESITPDEKINIILKKSLSYMRLSVGIVSHIDDDDYEVVYFDSDDVDMQPGQKFNLQETYCAKTIKENNVVSYHCAGESDIAKHPCYINFGMESYIGVPLYVDGELYGTVNFSSPEIRNLPFRDREKAFIRVISQWIGNEIAKKHYRRVQQDLDHARKLESVGQLAAGIAHEINTPTQYVGDHVGFLKAAFEDVMQLLEMYQDLQVQLAKAGGFAELCEKIDEVKDEIDLPFIQEEVPVAFDNSLDGVTKISEIVKAMKGFSHPGDRTKQLSDLNRAIENTITVCRNEWKYVADLTLDLDPSLPQVKCLEGELNQVFLNMVVNAAHAIADTDTVKNGGKGEIKIATRKIDEMVEIIISDTGPGVPEEIQNKIFDPFFTTKAVGKGTGQGLSIARSIVVDKHGGDIGFSILAEGGTRFVICIPIDDSQASDEGDVDEKMCAVC